MKDNRKKKKAPEKYWHKRTIKRNARTNQKMGRVGGSVGQAADSGSG